jgi:hypothetical protein
VKARIWVFVSPIYTITDREKDAAVEMIQAQSRMKKRIHLRFCTSRTGRDAQKRRWIRYAIPDCAWIISTEASEKREKSR